MSRVLFIHDARHQDNRKGAGGSYADSVACAVAVATTSQVINFATPLYAEEAIATAKADAEKQATNLLCFRLYRLE